MPDVTIQEVLAQREFDTQNGPMVAYKVRFAGSQGNGEAETKRKASSPAPAAGETFDAELIEGKFGPELKRIFAAKNGGSFNGGGRTEDPRKSAEIRRMASQKAAIALLAAEVAAGLTFKDEKASELLKPRIQFFEDDTKAAGERA